MEGKRHCPPSASATPATSTSDADLMNMAMRIRQSIRGGYQVNVHPLLSQKKDQMKDPLDSDTTAPSKHRIFLLVCIYD